MRIETGRLILREFTLDDVAAFHRLESMPEVVRFQSYPPRTGAESLRYVREAIESQSEHPRRHLELAVVPVGEEALIGRVGTWRDGPKAMLWYAFLPSVQGRGYATEAVRALMQALTEIPSFTIECDPENVRSWRLAERLGFVQRSLRLRAFEAKGRWVGSMVYEWDREVPPPDL